MTTRYSAAEIIEIAVQIENNGYLFYTGAAEKTIDADSKEIFLFLAAEEKKHISAFKELFANIGDTVPQGEYTDEYFSYLRALGDDHIFTGKSAGEDALAAVTGDIGVLTLALNFEKDSILLFTELLNVVADNARTLVQELIRQERQHFCKLTELKATLIKKNSIMS